jgi:hypothetical protein
MVTVDNYFSAIKCIAVMRLSNIPQRVPRWTTLSASPLILFHAPRPYEKCRGSSFICFKIRFIYYTAKLKKMDEILNKSRLNRALHFYKSPILLINPIKSNNIAQSQILRAGFDLDFSCTQQIHVLELVKLRLPWIPKREGFVCPEWLK